MQDLSKVQEAQRNTEVASAEPTDGCTGAGGALVYAFFPFARSSAFPANGKSLLPSLHLPAVSAEITITADIITHTADIITSCTSRWRHCRQWDVIMEASRVSFNLREDNQNTAGLTPHQASNLWKGTLI